MIELSENAGSTLLAINGEFDLASEPQFVAATKAALAKGCSNYIVDLDGVTYLDGRALAALLSFFKTVSATGGSVAIVTSNAFHRRLFSITGIDRVLSLFETRAQASAARPAHNRSRARSR
ncbi:MAG TPA: STAS domain-containing protein [Candidatus Eremiobacteraceae bacterium]|nr:STAS domain-containing protein [Candidatus Eremiobacteraceae bacterium]